MKYGLIGKKLAHSFSPQIHAMLGNAEYETLEIPQDELDDYMIKRDFCGINVTIPYKKAVMKHCDHISDAAKKIGSVNTIINKNGVLYGHNTDYDGFLHMTAAADFSGAKVLILGSGGTSLTARAVALDANASRVVTISRGGDKVACDIEVDTYEHIHRYFDSDIIINTTPVGMFPMRDKSPLSLEKFCSVKHVFDVVYNPLNTAFLQQAKALNIPYKSGLSMLVAQAAFAHQLFFDTKIDFPVINDIEKRLRKSVSNIVLVGMPGCGKSTIGRLLAKKAQLTFVDTDVIVTEKANMKIPLIFTRFGEPVFRRMESDAITAICNSKMQVIATGGGSVLSKSNRTMLAFDGIIVWLNRDLQSLEVAGRPLSCGADALQKLYEHRAPIYKQFADIIIDCDKTPSEIVAEIMSYL